MTLAYHSHPDARCERARAAFVENATPREVVQREAEIAALPAVQWKGRTLYTIRCSGDTGKGPHDVNVPEVLLWSLINIGRFRCPYHP